MGGGGGGEEGGGGSLASDEVCSEKTGLNSEK